MHDDRDAIGEIQLSLHAVDTLTASDKRAIIALCTEAFAEDFGQLFTLLPQSIHILAYLGDTLVSHACWVTRWLQPEGLAQLRTAYIEAVSTAPAYQGRGYGTAVMRRVGQEIQEYELGGLSTGRPSFYTRMGWELWRGPLAIRKGHDVVGTPHDTMMILRTAQTLLLNIDSSISAEWREGELW